MTRKRKTEARKKRKLQNLQGNAEIKKKDLSKKKGGSQGSWTATAIPIEPGESGKRAF